MIKIKVTYVNIYIKIIIIKCFFTAANEMLLY